MRFIPYNVGYLNCASRAYLQALLLWLVFSLPAILAGYLDASSGEERTKLWDSQEQDHIARYGSTSTSLGSADYLCRSGNPARSSQASASCESSQSRLGSPVRGSIIVNSGDGFSVEGDVLNINLDYNCWYFLVFREATRSVLPRSGALLSKQRYWKSKEDKQARRVTLWNGPPDFYLLSKFDAVQGACFYEEPFVARFPDLKDMNRDIWLPVGRTERCDHSINIPNLQNKLVYVFDSDCKLLYKSPRLRVIDANRELPLTSNPPDLNWWENME